MKALLLQMMMKAMRMTTIQNQNQAKILDEPELEFRYGQRITRPHTGLSLFGPFDADTGGNPRGIAYALVGTTEGLASFKTFAALMSSPVPSPVDKKASLWPMFPGFDVAFGLAWPSQPAWEEIVSRQALLDAASIYDHLLKRSAAIRTAMTAPRL
jgi:hypothetical protein